MSQGFLCHAIREVCTERLTFVFMTIVDSKHTCVYSVSERFEKAISCDAQEVPCY